MLALRNESPASSSKWDMKGPRNVNPVAVLDQTRWVSVVSSEQRVLYIAEVLFLLVRFEFSSAGG